MGKYVENYEIASYLKNIFKKHTQVEIRGGMSLKVTYFSNSLKHNRFNLKNTWPT